MRSIREKFLFYLVFLLLGVISVWLQVFFSREFLAVFGGSELVIGIIVFWWLIFTGLGSLLGAPAEKRLVPALVFSYFLLVIAYTAAFVIIKITPGFLTVAGEVVPLSWVFFVLPAVLLPVCLLLGWQFKLATKFFVQKFRQVAVNVNKAYLTEVAGFVVGGLVFNFLFVEVATVLLIWFMTVLFLLAVFIITFLLPKRTAFLLALIVVLSLTFFGWRVDWRELARQLLQPQFKNQEVVLSENSKYNKITITKFGEQVNFFASGNLLSPGSAKTNEETVWLSYLAAPNPKRLLVIGGGWSGIINEILKAKTVERVTYLEPDEKLFNKLTIYNPEFLFAFNDRRLEYLNQDPVEFFQDINPVIYYDRTIRQDDLEKFDVIIINQAPPVNLALNRFYTQEFFRQAKNWLAPAGVLSINLPGLAENLNDKFQNKFVSLIYQTLKSEFSQVKILPLERNYFLATASEIEAASIIERFRQLDIETKFLSVPYLDYVFNNEKTQRFNEIIAAQPSPVNKNLFPRGVVDYTIFQLQLQNLKLSQFIFWLNQNRVIILLGLSTILLVLLWWFKKKSQNFRFYFSVVMASGSLLVAEIMILLLWQVWLGNVYSQIAMLLSLIMLGLFLGNLTIIKLNIYQLKRLKKIQLFFWLVLGSFMAAINLVEIGSPVILIIYAILFGYFVGLIFPLVNKLYLDRVNVPEQRTSRIYGVELVGTAILILLFNLFLIPMFGFNVALGWLVLFNLLVLV